MNLSESYLLETAAPPKFSAPMKTALDLFTQVRLVRYAFRYSNCTSRQTSEPSAVRQRPALVLRATTLPPQLSPTFDRSSSSATRASHDLGVLVLPAHIFPSRVGTHHTPAAAPCGRCIRWSAPQSSTTYS